MTPEVPSSRRWTSPHSSGWISCRSESTLNSQLDAEFVSVASCATECTPAPFSKKIKSAVFLRRRQGRSGLELSFAIFSLYSVYMSFTQKSVKSFDGTQIGYQI